MKHGKIKIGVATFAVGGMIAGFGLVGGRDTPAQPPLFRGPKPVNVNAPGGPLHFLEQGDCFPLEPHVTCKQRLAKEK